MNHYFLTKKTINLVMFEIQETLVTLTSSMIQFKVYVLQLI
jgi:hypothetical protein